MKEESGIESGYGRVFVSDCEGPISKNDNAFELTKYFVPNGGEFFTLLSKYDDILSEIVQRSNYKRGNTLKLVLPFLKAYRATERKIVEYSRKNILLMHGADQTLEFVDSVMSSYLVSTSYEPYIRALCELTGFPFQNTYCTKIDIDRYKLTEEEIEELRTIRKDIARLDRIRIPEYTKNWEELPSETRKTVRTLDEIFNERFSEMVSGKMLQEVEPVGGVKKAKAIRDISEKIGSDFEDMMYVGDSITDVEALRFLKEEGGLTVSFNGNEYAVQRAEVAVLAKNTAVTSLLADIFNRFGKEGVLDLAANWNRESVKQMCQNQTLLDRLLNQGPDEFPYVTRTEGENLDNLIERSCEVRKRVRGERVGGLG